MFFNYLIKDTTPYGTPANDIELQDLGLELNLPEPEPDGKIKTFNKTGFMTCELDPYSKDFILYASQSHLPALEIGSAYGIATIEALKKGAKIIANDITPEHLLILKNLTPPSLRKNLTLNIHNLIQEFQFPSNSLSSILSCRVFHLLKGSDIEILLKKAHKWLQKNGRLYIIVMSPHHYALKNFFPQYDAKYIKGIPWPGEITNMKERVAHIADKIQNYLHVFDVRPFKALSKKYNFRIIKSGFFDYKNKKNIKDRSGKDYFGIILEKI